jgi:hypothetical protein
MPEWKRSAGSGLAITITFFSSRLLTVYCCHWQRRNLKTHLVARNTPKKRMKKNYSTPVTQNTPNMERKINDRNIQPTRFFFVFPG